MKKSARATVIAVLGWSLFWRGAVPARGARSEDMRVEVEVSPGVHHVGEGLELVVGVVGAGRRPEIDPPTIEGADVWRIRNDLRPVSVGGIGGMIGGTNVFLSRYRVVARRAGTLEVPSIVARLPDEAGRSRPLRLAIRPVPAAGRPSEFAGGVGRFALRAEARPRSVRVGEELEYRITVEGPAAWGMTARPELSRFDRVGLGLRVEPGPVAFIPEPPSRTFSYKLRPTRSGEATLPPVAIAAYDPASRHYMTRVTPSLPIRAVAVDALDPAAIPDLRASGERRMRRIAAIRRWAMAGASALLVGSAAAIAWVRRRARRHGQLGGEIAARRFAARTARGLGSSSQVDAEGLAQRINAALIRYLQLADGRPPGALTPDEAREGVARRTASDDLGERAAEIAARCDATLYRRVAGPSEDPGRLRDDARELFARLGRSRTRTGGPPRRIDPPDS